MPTNSLLRSLVELAATGVCHTDEFTRSGADPEGLFPAIFGVARNIKRFTVSPQHVSCTFVEPLRRNADTPGCGPSAFDSPTKHLHAVREVFLSGCVHGLPIARAPHMRESCS